MSILISLFILGISLSMDTFSISLGINTFNISKRLAYTYCILVGLMHFIMPIIGFFLGNKIINILHIDVNFLLGIILLFIGIEMIIDLKKENDKYEFNIISLFILSISVSLDSFSTGLCLSAITNNYILAGFIFSICAASFTFLGYIIGKYSKEKFGIYAKFLGIILVLIISVYHLFK